MDVILIPLFSVINIVIELYIWALIVSAVLSWLTAFGVLNTYNRFVAAVSDFLYRITEPALRPIRRLIPTAGGVDLSPLALILLLYLVQAVLRQLLLKML